MNSNEKFVAAIYRNQGAPPHGFGVELGVIVLPDPETKEPTTVYTLEFQNSEYQALSRNRQHFVDVARWLKNTHDAMSGYGLKVLIQPLFTDSVGLRPDQLKYKLQEIIRGRNKK